MKGVSGRVGEGHLNRHIVIFVGCKGLSTWNKLNMLVFVLFFQVVCFASARTSASASPPPPDVSFVEQETEADFVVPESIGDPFTAFRDAVGSLESRMTVQHAKLDSKITELQRRLSIQSVELKEVSAEACSKFDEVRSELARSDSKLERQMLAQHAKLDSRITELQRRLSIHSVESKQYSAEIREVCSEPGHRDSKLIEELANTTRVSAETAEKFYWNLGIQLKDFEQNLKSTAKCNDDETDSDAVIESISKQLNDLREDVLSTKTDITAELSKQSKLINSLIGKTQTLFERFTDNEQQEVEIVATTAPVPENATEKCISLKRGRRLDWDYISVEDLRFVISCAYETKLPGFDAPTFITNWSDDVERLIDGYTILVAETKKNGQSYSPDMLKIGYRIKALEGRSEFGKLPYQYKSKFLRLKASLPTSVELIIWNKVCLKSLNEQEYLHVSHYTYRSSKDSISDNNIFTWIPKNKIPESTWSFVSVDGGDSVHIYNTVAKKYLYASPWFSSGTTTNRVVLARGAPPFDVKNWRVVLKGDSTIELWNVKYNEIMFAAGNEFNFCSQRRRVFTNSGSHVSNSVWTVENCEM